jgi:FMN-dependent NADH-azoreductase
MPHLSLDSFGALMTPAEQRSIGQAASVAFADQLIVALEAADTIVLAVPMYNFSIPSTLKAWIDHVAHAGRTSLHRLWLRGASRGRKGLRVDWPRRLLWR